MGTCSLTTTINNSYVEVNMRTILGLCIGAIFLIVPLVHAQDNNAPVKRFVNLTIEQSEKSLVQALESNSFGMRLSAANTVRQLKEAYPEQSFSSLVFPLMRIVKDEGVEPSCRIVAAIALHELHSAVGDFAIARTAQFTDSPRVKHICSWLTYYRFLEDRG
jgi:hypothetical protein